MKKSKIVALALAGTLTATAMLAGTYAWTSISQRAVNESVGEVNPGGRLHDDFNGTNKDIYVENFTSDENGEGANIYARIRLSEYLSIGEGAGTTEGDKKNVEGEASTATIADPETWTIFKLSEKDNSIFRHYYNWEWGGGTDYMPTFNKNKDSLEADINGTLVGDDEDRNKGEAYNDYEIYTAGTSKEFGLEIFDIDGDSRDEDEYVSEEIIKALHNGAGGFSENFYNLADGADGVIKIEENAEIELPATKITGDPVMTEDNPPVRVKYKAVVKELFYKDPEDENSDVVAVSLDIINTEKDAANGKDEAEESGEADIKVAIVTDKDGNIVQHTAAKTLQTEGVISMTEWVANGSKPGPYWVYDNTDGWAYWAQEIEPGEATGCLLTGIQRKGSIVDKYYYGINVTAEFATAGDWGEGKFTTVKDDGTLDIPTDGTGFYKNGITEQAMTFLNTIAGAEKDLFVYADKSYTETAGVTPGAKLNLTAEVKLGSQTVSGDEVEWSIANADQLTDAGENGTHLVDAEDGTATLYVGAEEEAPYVTVKAALKAASDDVYNTLSIRVGEVYTVTVDDKNVYLYAENEQSATLKATVRDQRGTAYTSTSAIEWSLTDNSRGADIRIEDGKLVIEDNIDATTIGVKATATVNGVTVEDTGDIEVKSQMEYIASLTIDNSVAGKETMAVVDGVKWYVLRKQDVNTEANDGLEALLWSVEPVSGWETGSYVKNDAGNYIYYGWKYWNADNPFKSTEDVTDVSGYQNWWRYSNLRTWLNSTGTDEGYPVWNVDEDGKKTLITDTAGLSKQTYNGFLKDKDILRTNAVPVDIYTRKEYDTVGNPTDFDKATGDKVFIFTQADIYGHAPTLKEDENGTITKDGKKYTYEANGTAVELDYTVDANLYSEISATMRTTANKWYWLRSPRSHADNVSHVNYSGNISVAGHGYSTGCVRPALWLNLSSSAQ